MRSTFVSLGRSVASLAVASTLAAPVRADLGPLEPLADFHRAVHDALGLPEPLIVRLLEKGLPDDDLPVVGMIAARASVPVETVVDLRFGGMSYFDLTIRFGLTPEIFYVPIEADPGPPYGNAWGYYRKTPRAQWATLRLADADIVNYANLKLCVDHYRVAPLDVVALRKQGKKFAAVHSELHGKGKGGGKAASSKSSTSKKSKGSKNKKPSDPPGKPPRG